MEYKIDIKIKINYINTVCTVLNILLEWWPLNLNFVCLGTARDVSKNHF